MIAPTETELIKLLQQGDRAAFESIYCRYFNAVFRNVHKLTRNVLATEDIVQDVFLALWKSRERINPERSVSNWLFALSYYKAVDQLRKQIRQSLATEAIKNTATIDTDDNGQFEMQWQLLENALTQLSPQKRRVFELCKLEGRSYEEAAALMQISKHTVKEYLSSATHFLKEYAQRQKASMLMSGGLLLFLLYQ